MATWRKLSLIVSFASVIVCYGEAVRPSLEQLQRKAEAGDVAALVELGEAQEQDPAYFGKAAETYTRAIERGSTDALVRLGMLHEYGHGVPQSYAKARDCYEKADAGGNALAAYRLGLFYLEGWGVPKDNQRAIQLFQRAAEMNFVPAMRTLAYLYNWGIGVTADPKHGLEWAERAAKHNDPEGEAMAGALHLSRQGTMNKSVSQGRQWLSQSAQKEYTQAMVLMAGSYIDGSAGQRDLALAKRWLELALESGDPDAGYILALHENFVAGPCQEPNADSIRKYLQTASDLGNFTAKEVLELAAQGKSFREALLYVWSVPFVTRYLQRASEISRTSSPMTDRPPQVNHMVDAIYPVSLRVSGLEGEVQMQFVVDTEGKVRNPVAISSTHPAFTDAAQMCVLQWRFVPAFKNGRVVNTRMQVPMYFRLNIEPRARGQK
jgi:TonB family protein